MFDDVLAFFTVIGSSIAEETGVTLYNLTGISGQLGEDGDDDGEQAFAQENYQSIGIVGRPLPPDDDGRLETIGARTGDGIVSWGYRDLRLHKSLNPGGGATTPSEGQLMFVHYFGGFLSGTPTAENSGDQKASLETWYCPYDFTDGVPDKAHVMVMDPSGPNPNIQIVHGEGMFISMVKDEGSGKKAVLITIDSDTFLRMSPGESLFQCAKIILKGNVVLGVDPANAIPLIPLELTQATPSVFFSPT